jgi:photosystem II stability/assembly factor-like uncharacterized protein
MQAILIAILNFRGKAVHVLFVLGFLPFACCSVHKGAGAQQNEGLVSPPKQGSNQAIYSGQIIKIARLPEVSNEPGLIASNNSLYYHTKSTLWRTDTREQQWEQIYHYQAKDLNDADMHQIKEMLLTDTSLIILVPFGYLLESTDAGKSWRRINVPLSIIYDLNISREDGVIYACGSIQKSEAGSFAAKGCYFESTNGESKKYSVCLRSRNQGTSWEQVAYPCEAANLDQIILTPWGRRPGLFASMRELATLNEKGEWKVKRILSVSNKGAKLFDEKIIQAEEDASEWAPAFEGITNVHFINEKTGWVSLAHGDLLGTENGGRDWARKIEPGKVWTDQSGALRPHFVNIAFRDSLHGVALDDQGALFVTEHGGQDMKLVPFDEAVNCFVLQENECLFIAGEYLYRLSFT